eukprot:649074-Alexandrium_andersonii.AAC.1
MSASLVGSEMCIRDRWSCPAAWLFPRRVEPGGNHGTRGKRRRGRGVGPVSYTHLTLPTICSV